MKQIVVDARFFFASGIGVYLRNILPALIQRRSDLSFALLVQPRDRERIRGELPGAALISCPLVPLSISEQIFLPRYLPAHYDLLWIPHFNFPALTRGPHLVTLHDLSLRSAHYPASTLQRLYARILFPIMARRARAILSDSGATLRELIRYYGNRANLYRSHLGVDVRRFGKKSRIGRSSGGGEILCIGSVKPHKNIGRLLQAYSLLPDKKRPDLAIIGRTSGLRTMDSASLAAGQSMPQVHFLGELADAELVTRLQRASLFVFPTLFEGFGFPPLEAMAAGVPVAASNIPVLHEICGDAPYYFDPLLPSDIANAIQAALRPGRQRRLKQGLGTKRISQFQWSHTIAETSAVLDIALNPEYSVTGPSLNFYKARVARYAIKRSAIRKRPSRLQPLVSIITVTLNARTTIEQTIRSVWAQDYPNIEYIVLDGGSSDGTWEFLQKFRSRFSTLVQIDDLGISDALNQGIAMARGEIIGLIHSDDWYEPEAVGLSVEALRRQLDRGFVCAAQQYWRNEQRDALFPSHPEKIGIDMTVNHPTCFVRRSVYQEAGLFKLHYKAAMDYEYFLRLRRLNIRGIALSQVTANMRYGGTSDRGWVRGLSEIRMAQSEIYPGSIRFMLFFFAKAVKSVSGRLLESLGLQRTLRFYRQHISSFTRTFSNPPDPADKSTN